MPASKPKRKEEEEEQKKTAPSVPSAATVSGCGRGCVCTLMMRPSMRGARENRSSARRRRCSTRDKRCAAFFTTSEAPEKQFKPPAVVQWNTCSTPHGTQHVGDTRALHTSAQQHAPIRWRWLTNSVGRQEPHSESTRISHSANASKPSCCS